MYCAWRIPAHLRCTQCSILLHLMDICFLTCICLWQISQIQTFLFKVLWSSVSTNRLHMFLRCSFVVLVISAYICCRAGEVGSLDLRSSRALILSNISTGTGSVLIWCRSEGICCDAAFRMMVLKIFSLFWQFVGSRHLLSLSSLRYRSQFAFFKLKLVRLGMGLIVRSICKLMRIGRWSEPRFVFQLVEVIREADANETSGEDGLAW